MAGSRRARTDDRLIARARRCLPGGTVHTFGRRPSGFPAFYDSPDFVIERGRGPWLWSTGGERFLDLVLGGGSVLLGHAHPAVVSAVAAQAARGANFCHLSIPLIELAEEVVAAVPSADKARFFNSGTEAMMHAIRIARAHTGRERVLKLDGAYHGGLDELLVRTSFGPVAGAGGTPLACDSPGAPAGRADGVVVVPYNDLDALRAAVDAWGRELAALVVEPVMRGIRPLPGYLPGVCQIAREARLPLVFDEVMTGFRLALGGAQEFYGVAADLTVLAKGLGAGAPLGAVAGTEEMMAWFDTGRPDGGRILCEGSTYGNALAAAAGLAGLRELRRPETYPRLHRTGERIAAGLTELFGRHGLEAHSVGVGPLVEFYFGEAAVLDYASAQASDQRVKHALARGLRGRGVFAGGGRYNLSTAHGEAEAEILLAAAADVLEEFSRR